MAWFRGLGGGGVLVVVLALVAAACGGGTSAVIAERSGGSGVGTATPVTTGSVATTTIPSMVAVPVRSVPDPLASLGLRDSDGCIVMAHSAAEIQAVLDSVAPDLAASISVADLVARAKSGGVEAISGELAVLEERFGKAGVESVMDGLLNPEPRVCEPTVTAGVDPEPVPQSMVDDVRNQSSRPGYFGPFYRDRVVQSSVPSFEVLPKTVTTTNGVDGATVRGIAVNNSSTSAGSPQVEIGGVVVGPAAVNMVLPGEPVPFEVTVPAIDQSQLSTLKVIGTPGPDDPPGRAFGIAIWWTLQGGVRERMKTAGMWEEPLEPPYPAVVAVGVRNHSGQNLTGTRATVAWFAADGSVEEVAELPVEAGNGPLKPDQTGGLAIVMGSDQSRLWDDSIAIWGWTK